MKQPRFRKLAEAALAAEARRAALEKALTEAEADLHTAFNDLFDDYIRSPHPIQIDEQDADKARQLVTAWVTHSHRRTSELFAEVKCLWPASPPQRSFQK